MLVLLLSTIPYSLFSKTVVGIQEQYSHALKLIGEDKSEQAIAELRSIIDDHPEFPKTYRSLIDLFIYTNNLDSAQVYFHNVVQRDPKNAYVYYSLARIDLIKKKYDSAIEKLKKSIELDPQFVDAYSHHGGLPEAYRAKKDLDSGIKFFENQIAANPVNPYAYFGLARCHILKYNWETALDLLNKAIELEPHLLLAYHAKIYINYRTSHYDKAFHLSTKLLKLAKELNDAEMMTYAAMMIGNSYFTKGDYLNALQFLNDALKTAQKTGDKKRESTCLNTIAATYAMTANFTKALQYFRQSLLLAQKTGSSFKQVQALDNIANIQKDQGHHEEALSIYKQALAKARENKFKYEESLALANMGEIYQKRKEFQKALELENSALKITIAIDDKAEQGFILRNLGSLYQDLGDIPRAIKNLNKAYSIGSETHDLQIIWETEAGLGSCYEKQGQTESAIKHYANAIAIYDSVRNTLDIESLRESFLEDKYLAYPSIVSLLAQNGHIGEAFQFAEKYKAKTILDIVSQRRTLFSHFVSDTLRTKLQNIISQHEAADKSLSVELAKKPKDEPKLISLDQKITDLELQKAALIADLKIHQKQFYNLTTPDILRPFEIQQRISDQQALIEYIVGFDKTTVFVITKDTLSCLQIPFGRKQLIDKLANLSAIFTEGNRASGPESMQVINPQLADFSIPPAYVLYEILLKPLEPILQDKDDLIIVPDDILSYLPFEVLVFDTSKVETRYDFANARFILEEYVISYVSSASLTNPDLQKTGFSTKGILAIGNPDFGTFQNEQTDLLTSKDIAGTIGKSENLPPLPNSETEVKSIDKVLTRTENKIITGQKADEATFKQEAPSYAIIHLATHFIYNDDQPLYSKFAFSQSSQNEEDGFLQTYEIFDMKLNADLAVLSACNSGLGKLRKGEGLIGISRAFLFAGVPSTVMSLWNVDDKSTSKIMQYFYQHLEAGLNKKQALQQAKLNYLRSAQNYGKDPFYWAAFILTGDWSPIHFHEYSKTNYWPVGIFGLLIFASALLILKRKLIFKRS